MPRRKIVGTLTDEMVTCRSVGHAWDDNMNPEHFASFGWPLYLRCARCWTEKYLVFDARGNKIGIRYSYPEGYSQGKGVTRAQMYVELFKRKKQQGIVQRQRKIVGIKPNNVVSIKGRKKASA